MTNETVVASAALSAGFEDLYVLDTEDVEVFVLDLNGPASQSRGPGVHQRICPPARGHGYRRCR